MQAVFWFCHSRKLWWALTNIQYLQDWDSTKKGAFLLKLLSSEQNNVSLWMTFLCLLTKHFLTGTQQLVTAIPTWILASTTTDSEVSVACQACGQLLARAWYCSTSNARCPLQQQWGQLLACCYTGPAKLGLSESVWQSDSALPKIWQHYYRNI